MSVTFVSNQLFLFLLLHDISLSLSFFLSFSFNFLPRSLSITLWSYFFLHIECSPCLVIRRCLYHSSSPHSSYFLLSFYCTSVAFSSFAVSVSVSVSACDSSMMLLIVLASFYVCVNLVVIMNICPICFLVLRIITTYITWDDDTFWDCTTFDIVYDTTIHVH